ncbi:response regulator [Leptospira gomenensis]|uniref:Response regulator n=1 Tax=Leptospira gomenensis TaxID=2484974 RepID=A0A5F1YRR4_9LEPT|nr:response regulator [Leptospira gomenensis]TGK30875.1 response regulator [Leptospira gomenensis]TGK32513.1 response regulator [Leptospira gomenensis]TGK45405.1 response regulator [Leptospira gomenensis]TGK60603.1 response regulator [Leptospira gomenensis]
MIQKLNCILLIDDNQDDNFFHERVIRKGNYAEMVVSKQSAESALDYLKGRDLSRDPRPDLIFLDINMPGMNGWEFLEEYNHLPPEFQSRIIVVMLTTSDNLDDKEKAKRFGILSDFKTKPLTDAMLRDILEEYF